MHIEIIERTFVPVPRIDGSGKGAKPDDGRSILLKSSKCLEHGDGKDTSGEAEESASDSWERSSTSVWLNGGRWVDWSGAVGWNLRLAIADLTDHCGGSGGRSLNLTVGDLAHHCGGGDSWGLNLAIGYLRDNASWLLNLSVGDLRNHSSGSLDLTVADLRNRSRGRSSLNLSIRAGRVSVNVQENKGS